MTTPAAMAGSRNSDGSEYREMLTGRTIYATIKNIPQETFYRRGIDPHGPWSAQPMILPPEGWKPMTFNLQSPKMVRLTERFEGMEVYRQEFGNGPTINILVPNLNFLTVLSDLQVKGRRVRFYNIVRGEPQPNLFEPPTGAEIRKSSTPGGIIFSEEHPEHPRQ
jgi:hypothetical protein